MKAVRIVLALILAGLALALIFFSYQALQQPAAMVQALDPDQASQQDSRMQKARDKVLDGLADNDRSKTLRALERYVEGYGDRLALSGAGGRQLFLYRHGPSLMALSLFLLLSALVLLVRALCRREKLRRLSLYALPIAALYVAVYITENLAGSTSMLMMVLKKGAIFALIAVAMNLLNGFTGLFSLGQAGFMLVGAYTYAIFTIDVASRAQVYAYYGGGLIQFALPSLVALLLAGIVSGLFAFLIGLPVLRLKSDYLAIATLGFAEIIRALFQYDGLGPITNGSNLLRRFATFGSALYPFLVAGICIALIALLIHSSYGRAFKAIRDDEIAAEAMGINLFRHKQMAFVISSFFAGVGGALLAMYQTTVQANAFTAAMTYELLLIVVIGGMGSLSGSVIASFLFVASSEWWLRFLDNEQVVFGITLPLMRPGFRMVVFSIIIMLMVLFYRRGIMGDKELNFSRMLGISKKDGGRRG